MILTRMEIDNSCNKFLANVPCDDSIESADMSNIWEQRNEEAKQSRKPRLNVMIKREAISKAMGRQNNSVEGASAFTCLQSGPSLSRSTLYSYIDSSS